MYVDFGNVWVEIVGVVVVICYIGAIVGIICWGVVGKILL